MWHLNMAYLAIVDLAIAGAASAGAPEQGTDGEQLTVVRDERLPCLLAGHHQLLQHRQPDADDLSCSILSGQGLHRLWLPVAITATLQRQAGDCAAKGACDALIWPATDPQFPGIMVLGKRSAPGDRGCPGLFSAARSAAGCRATRARRRPPASPQCPAHRSIQSEQAVRIILRGCRAEHQR